MTNKAWRPVGGAGPGINEVPSGYERMDRGSRPGAVSTRTMSDDTIVIVLSGTIDGYVTKCLRTVLVAALLRARPRRLVLDLRAVSEVDALGMGTIVAGCQNAEDCGTTVVMDSAGQDVVARLHQAGLPASVLMAV